MKKATDFLGRLVPRRISAQLTILFMTTFLLTMSASMTLLYGSVDRTLRNNYEQSSLASFRQSEYNIDTLLETVDLISRKLVLDADLNTLFDYESLSDVDRVLVSSAALRQFNNIISNYPYVSSVVFYTSDGLAVKASASINSVQYGESVLEDWFYDSPVFLDASANQANLICFGGYNASDFGFSADREANPSGYYICAARNTRARTSVGTLVINISMEHLNAVFTAPSPDSPGKSYVINEDGAIIISSNPEEIGSVSSRYREMSDGLRSEAFRIDGENEPIEAVYYRTDSGIGILVNEMPVSAITGDINALRGLIVLLFCGGVCFAFLLSRFLIRRLTRPIRDLTEAFAKVESGSLGFKIPERPIRNELGELVAEFNLMSAAIEQTVQQTLQDSEEKRRLEMRALRAQINPHFIYNTLNIIKWMAVIERKTKIADCITTFSRFLQATLREVDPLCTPPVQTAGKRLKRWPPFIVQPAATFTP